jgi:hypothetical protein
LSTLALDGPSGASGHTRLVTALRYLDLVLLAAALPVFIVADLPIVAWIVVAGVWAVQYAIEYVTDRAVARAAAEGDRKGAMGWIGATTLARVWIVALAVLLVGVISSKDAGLAAALLSLILFTVHLVSRVLGHLVAPSDGAGGS